MTDNEILNVGDVCTYSYDNTNKSLSVVEVVKVLSDECVVVKFHQVIVDDSGNGLFTYLCNKDKTMNVSKKYLCKIDLINIQKAEIERLQIRNKTLAEITKNYDWKFEKAKVEAIKEFAERLKEKADRDFWQECCYVDVEDIDNLVSEMIGGD